MKTGGKEKVNENDQRLSFLAQEKAEEEKLSSIRDKFASKLDQLSPVARASVLNDIRRTKNPTIKEVDEIIFFHREKKIDGDSG